MNIYEVSFEGTRDFGNDARPKTINDTITRHVVAETTDEAISKYKAMYASNGFGFTPTTLVSVVRTIKGVIS